MINLVIPAFIVSCFALLFSLVAIVLVLAQKFSTHRIEWKALETHEPFKEDENEINSDEDELKEILELQRSKKRKQEDPLDVILETNNF